MAQTAKTASTSLTPSSIDCLAPRISFSEDFSSQGAHSAPHGTMKEIFMVSDSPPRLSFSKSSPSEFEFSVSIQDQESSHDQTMLAADELFHDGVIAIARQPVAARRRSSTGEYVIPVHTRAEELGRVKIDQYPISPKGPTCTSRWKELLGLKKLQVQAASNGRKLQKEASYPNNGMASARGSMDSLEDPTACLHYGGLRIPHWSKDTEPTHLSSPILHSELPPLLCNADPGLCPTADLPMWQMNIGTSGSQLSKSCDEIHGVSAEAPQSQRTAVGQTAMVKQRNRAKSPAKPNEQKRHTIVAVSPRPVGAGAKGIGGDRPWGGNRSTESSRSTMATRLVVRGLDRSHSSPKPAKKRYDQLRSARQRSPADGSRAFQRSISYSAGVKVTPVINVPIYISPSLRKGSKNGIFGFSHLFSSKKDKVSNTLCSNCLHSHPA